MSDGTISQDEIDALLSGVGMSDVGSATGSTSHSNIDTATLEKFADGLKDKLKANLNTMTGVEFEAGKPTCEKQTRDELLAKIPEMVVAVMADFNAVFTGDHLFILAPEFAQKLCSLINKEENAELDEMALSVISEVVSQHSGAEITELTNGGKLPGLAANPAEAVHVPKAMVRIPQGDFALFTYPVTLEGTEYTLWEAISSEVANSMASSLGGGSQTEDVGTLSAADLGSLGGMATPSGMGGMGGAMGGMGAPMGGMQMGGMGSPMGGMGGMGAPMGGMNGMMGGAPMGGMAGQPMMGMGMNMPNVQSLQYPSLQGTGAPGEQGNIGLIMDVFMEMTVELGRTKKQIKEILGMGEGTIIELDKLAGEPVDILVNHKPIAKGEVVVIDENFGVRVTEILSPMERVSDLH